VRGAAPLAFPFGLLGANQSGLARHATFPGSALSSDLTDGSHSAPGVTTLFAGPVAGTPPPAQAAPAAPVSTVDTGQPPKPPRHATASAQRKAPPAGGADDERIPTSPSAPPGHGVVAGSASSSGGGAAPMMFFAILLGVLAYAAQELRRHRFRLVLVDPVGLVSPQQRPG
jgi:hypothetical protein